MKFIHEGRIIMIQPDSDVFTSSESMLHISHSEDDIYLTEFTFDEVKVFSLEDDNRDLVPMSFDQHNNTLVLSMMRGMFTSMGRESLLLQFIMTDLMG